MKVSFKVHRRKRPLIRWKVDVNWTLNRTKPDFKSSQATDELEQPMMWHEYGNFSFSFWHIDLIVGTVGVQCIESSRVSQRIYELVLRRIEYKSCTVTVMRLLLCTQSWNMSSFLGEKRNGDAHSVWASLMTISPSILGILYILKSLSVCCGADCIGPSCTRN